MGKKTIIVAAVTVTVLWVIWVLQYRLLRYLGIEWNGAALGQWGDTFGALNAFFAAFAFLGVAVTLAMQRQQMALQQKEIYDSLAEQHRQRFESSFFQLLDLLRDLRTEAVYSAKFPERRVVAGPAAFKAAHDDFIVLMQHQRNSGNLETVEQLSALYSTSVHMEGENEFGPYFRIIYTILRRISEDDVVEAKDKTRYGNLLRSQLSSAEIGLAGLNALTPASNDFRKFVDEFRLLKYLPQGDLRDLLAKFYKGTTFAARD